MCTVTIHKRLLPVGFYSFPAFFFFSFLPSAQSSLSEARHDGPCSTLLVCIYSANTCYLTFSASGVKREGTFSRRSSDHRVAFPQPCSDSRNLGE